MDLDREIRLRYRDLVLALAVGVAMDVAAVILVYVADASPLGPLRRFGGPWGLPCITAERCAAPRLPANPRARVNPSADQQSPRAGDRAVGKRRHRQRRVRPGQDGRGKPRSPCSNPRQPRDGARPIQQGHLAECECASTSQRGSRR